MAVVALLVAVFVRAFSVVGNSIRGSLVIRSCCSKEILAKNTQVVKIQVKKTQVAKIQAATFPIALLIKNQKRFLLVSKYQIRKS